jgi:hypothetical protein
MIRLMRNKQPRSLDLGFGVSVVVKPLSFALWRAASLAAERQAVQVTFENGLVEAAGGVPRLAGPQTRACCPRTAMEMQKLGHQERLEEIEVQADIAESRAPYRHDAQPSGVKRVDGRRASCGRRLCTHSSFCSLGGLSLRLLGLFCFAWRFHRDLGGPRRLGRRRLSGLSRRFLGLVRFLSWHQLIRRGAQGRQHLLFGGNSIVESHVLLAAGPLPHRVSKLTDTILSILAVVLVVLPHSTSSRV